MNARQASGASPPLAGSTRSAHRSAFHTSTKASPLPPAVVAESDLDVPLCVDCDGTLIAGDLLFESALWFISKRFLHVLSLAGWLLRGKAHLKQRLAERASIDFKTLPYRETFLADLREQRARGRKLFLVTAADEFLARQIADYLGCFDGVIASDGKTNLKGHAKATRLIARFGRGGFDYAGDHPSDLPVWQAARKSIAVAASTSICARLTNLGRPVAFYPAKEPSLSTWMSLMRVHQWSKNLLILVPLLTSHQFTDLQVLANSVLGFFAFGFAGSASYILNDLADIQNDRRHPSKRLRPIAAGEISPQQALIAAPLLLLASAALCLCLPAGCAVVLAAYLVLTFAYTLFLKRILLVDVVLLAALYSIRLFFGHAASGIAQSIWLLTFAIFIFFSLALAKRFTELITPSVRSGGQLCGRGYRAGDEIPVGALGAASGLVAVLVLVLYAHSPDVQKLYHQPLFLLLLCPLFLYWIGRIWILAHRGDLHHDPVVFALHDPNSYVVGLTACGLIVAATL